MATVPMSIPETPNLTLQQKQQHQCEVAANLGLEVVFHDAMADGSEGPAMVVIPPGIFEMGSPWDEFGHTSDEHLRVETLRQPFALGQTTVTADEFARYQADTGFVFRSDLITTRGRQPVVNIRRSEAETYAKWLSSQTGQRYRLPTELEWEYACRAGTTTPFYYGASVSCREVNFNPAFPYQEQIDKKKWFLPRCLPMGLPEPVGEKPANAWGLYDMHGNVWEFTRDAWNDRGRALRVARMVVKGGSYFDSSTLARSAARRPRVVDELDVNLGIRLLRELVD